MTVCAGNAKNIFETFRAITRRDGLSFVLAVLSVVVPVIAPVMAPVVVSMIVVSFSSCTSSIEVEKTQKQATTGTLSMESVSASESAVALSWTEVQKASFYKITVASDSACLTSLVTVTVKSTSATIDINIADTKAFVCVEAFDSKGKAIVGAAVKGYELARSVLESVQTPTATPSGGVFANQQLVSLNALPSGASIYFTTDGSEPTGSSMLYTAAIPIAGTTTIKAIGLKNGFKDSILMSETYTLKVSSPIADIPAGAYGPSQMINFTSATNAATVHYTTDGSAPTCASASGPVAVTASTLVKAIACKANFSDSNVANFAYTINGAAANPTANVPPGTFGSAQSVSLASTTPGVSIYYTLDGTTPSISSIPYVSPIAVAATMTIKAIALKSGYSASGISLFTYTINAVPTITLSAPAGNDDFVQVGGSLTVSYTASDPDDDAQITFRYDSSSANACAGTQIGSVVSENSGGTNINWNTSGVAAGSYYICASITDGVNAAQTALSGIVVIYSGGTCVWTGSISTTFGAAGNWMGCPAAGAPAASDSIVVPATTANQPIVSTNATIGGFGSGSGGGTVTVNAGVTLTLVPSGPVNIRSSVQFKGSVANCSTCKIDGASGISVLDNATLTLMSGISIYMFGGDLQLGNGTSAGHLVADVASTDTSQWPMIYGHQGYGRGAIRLEGTSTNLSSLSVNGLRNFDFNQGNGVFKFVANYRILRLDNVSFYINEPAYRDFVQYNIDIAGCTGAEYVDTSWDNLLFEDTSRNINTVAGCASTMPNITITGSGRGYGEPFETDAANKISWTNGAESATACVWTGAANSTSWTDPLNWSSCTNGRGNYPDQLNWVVVPSAPSYQPVINSVIGIRGIAAGAGGGTITVNEGSRIHITAGSGNIKSDIQFIGGTARCGACEVSGNLYVINGAQLTVLTDLSVRSTAIQIGTSSSNGKLRVYGGSDAARWTTFGFFYEGANWGGWGGISVNGTSATRSTVDISGVRMNKIYHYALVLGGNFDVLNLDNVYISTDTSGSDTISITSCSNSVFSDTNWSAIHFDIAAANLVAPKNVLMTNANCSSMAAVSITGGGLYFGSVYESDTYNKFSWIASCSGTSYSGECLYLGGAGQSCSDVCAVHGGESPAFFHAGLPYGGVFANFSNLTCSGALTALLGYAVSASADSTTNGIGCARNNSTYKNFNGAKTYGGSALTGYERVCTCQQ
jgi:hypothetical protein